MTFSISQLCREFGVTARAIRFYEAKGLLTPERNALGSRRYSERDRTRVQLVRRGQQVGLSLAEIREIFALYSREDSSAQQAYLLVKFQERIAAFDRQRVQVDMALEVLHAASERLEAEQARGSEGSLLDQHPEPSHGARRGLGGVERARQDN